MSERVWNGHVLTVSPERLVPPIGYVMQDDEVADLLVLRDAQLVELLLCGRIDGGGQRYQGQESEHGRLHEMQAGRFERLHEAPGQPERHAVAIPEFLP